MILSGVTTPGQSGPTSDGNKEVHRILLSFSIPGASPSDCLVLYRRYSLGQSHPSAKIKNRNLIYIIKNTERLLNLVLFLIMML